MGVYRQSQGRQSPVLLDSISVVNGQAAYTMQKNSVNYSPASELTLQVSLNGLIQHHPTRILYLAVPSLLLKTWSPEMSSTTSSTVNQPQARWNR